MFILYLSRRLSLESCINKDSLDIFLLYYLISLPLQPLNFEAASRHFDISRSGEKFLIILVFIY